MREDDGVYHRGVKIEQRGRRWRWQLRDGVELVRPSYATLDDAIAGLDLFLRSREHRRMRRVLQSVTPVTIGELCEGWFRDRKPRLAPATVQQYGIHIRVHIGEIASADANTIRPRDLEAFYASLRWKPARESHRILRQAFEWGLRNQLLVRESNPLLVVRPDRRSCTDHDGSFEEAGTVRPVYEKEIPTVEEVEKLVLDAEYRGLDTWLLYLETATATGARPGEICALQRKHLDPDACTVRIEWSADRIGGKIKRPKTRWSIRTLCVGPVYFNIVDDYLPPNPDDFLFPSNTQPGARSPLPCWNSRGVKRRLDVAIDRTGIPHYTPHAFRHFVATHLLAAGHSPMQVARFLGHANDTLVRQLYGRHIIDDEQRRIGLAASYIRLGPRCT